MFFCFPARFLLLLIYQSFFFSLVIFLISFPFLCAVYLFIHFPHARFPLFVPSLLPSFVHSSSSSPLSCVCLFEFFVCVCLFFFHLFLLSLCHPAFSILRQQNALTNFASIHQRFRKLHIYHTKPLYPRVGIQSEKGEEPEPASGKKTGRTSATPHRTLFFSASLQNGQDVGCDFGDGRRLLDLFLQMF